VNDCNFTVQDFTNLFESLLRKKKNKIFTCSKENVKCLKDFCVCCKVEGPNKRTSMAKQPNS
jgi:hypothetical protein